MLNIILIQTFWFSFFLVGLAGLLLWRRLFSAKANKSAICKFLNETHFGISAFVIYATGLAALIPFVVAGYVFEWPLAALATIYLVVLALSVFIIVLDHSLIWQFLRKRIKWRDSNWLINGALVFAFLAFDFVTSLHSGTPLDGDSPDHIAFIQSMLNTHMNLADPFFGYNGVLDLKYSTNLLNAYQAIIAHILNLQAYAIWIYSYAFYKLILWASFFAIAKVFLPKKAPNTWAYIILIVTILANRNILTIYAELPHCIVFAWFSLFLIGLKQLIEKKSAYILVLASLLIAVTHSVAALTAATFLVIMIILFLLFRKNLKLRLSTATVALIILLVPVVANKLIPTRYTGGFDTNYVGADGIHNSALYTYRVGSIILPHLKAGLYTQYASPFVDIHLFLMTLLLIPYVIFLKKLKKSPIKLLALIIIALAALAVFNIEYVSIIGYIYLIYVARSKLLKFTLFCLFIFYVVIAYNPIVLTATFNSLPLWVLTRFQDFNTIAVIAPIIGTLVLFKLLTEYWDYPELYKNYTILIIIGIAVFLPLHKFPINIQSIFTQNSTQHQESTADAIAVKQLNSFSKYINNKVIFTDDIGVTSYINFVDTDGYTGQIYNKLSSQSANIVIRQKCQIALTNNLSINDLKAANVSYIVLAPGLNKTLQYTDYSYHQLRLQKIDYIKAKNLSYLKLVDSSGSYDLYKVNFSYAQPSNSNSVCYLPYGQ